ncbi:MAG TPA: DUF447 domain-containing protein [Acetobacteraceae bacterium]
MTMIRETVVTTMSADGTPHVAPFGLIEAPGGWIIAPFHPSTTLDNLRAVPQAVANYTDDVRIFAGCLTGRRDWDLRPSRLVAPKRLAATLAHAEMEVVSVQEDAMRPRFLCRIVHSEAHAPFAGFNRAQAAVIEACILVSRLSMLPREKVEQEIAYLEIAIGKTAGDPEREAWEWLMEAVRLHYAASSATATAGAQSPSHSLDAGSPSKSANAT